MVFFDSMTLFSQIVIETVMLYPKIIKSLEPLVYTKDIYYLSNLLFLIIYFNFGM